MADLALDWQTDGADLLVEDDDLGGDDGLRTAILLSLFTDRRAEADDNLPAGDGDRRGWWADEFSAVGSDRIGSRLWLLDRSKATPDIAKRAEEIAREALAWLIEDRVASSVDVAAAAGGILTLAVTVHRPTGDPVAFRFAQVWTGI
jgi:phage gp46-like protein